MAVSPEGLAAVYLGEWVKGRQEGGVKLSFVRGSWYFVCC